MLKIGMGGHGMSPCILMLIITPTFQVSTFTSLGMSKITSLPSVLDFRLGRYGGYRKKTMNHSIPCTRTVLSFDYR